LARAFQTKTGIRVELLDGGDAGLLLRKIKGADADVVLGFDQLSVPTAREASRWRPLRSHRGDGPRFQADEFLAVDHGALAFIYRRAEVEPPRSLDDLADARFKNSIALPDPRASSPGLQFLFWILDRKGVDGGFAFIKRLAPNIVATPPSWSTAYGLFQKKRAKLGLGYLTSPLYHELEEADRGYAAAVFAEGHPEQIEFVGVPGSCRACEAAETFALWLQEPTAQRLIMRKNYMLPLVAADAAGTAFASVPPVPILDLKTAPELLQKLDDLFARWARTGL
jgi:thiamine transport system substrate-binding protein